MSVVPASAQSAESVRVLREAASKGNPAAIYALGAAAEKDGDMASAVAWYRNAALAGYAGAQYNLARVLELGKGVPQDPIEAETWYRKAAEAKFAPAVERVRRIDTALRNRRAAAPPATAASSPAPAVPAIALTPPPAPPRADWSVYGVYALAAVLSIVAIVALPAFAGRRRR